jgi:colicin import membrane protein
MILKKSFYPEIDEKLRKFLTQSIAIHISILLGVITFSFIINFTIKQNRTASIKIVESSVKVDMVTMPELTLKELKTMGLPQIGTKIFDSKVIIKKTIIKDNDFLKVKKKNDFLSMMKDMAKKKVIGTKKKIKNKKEQGSLDGVARGDLQKLILQGNKLSKGSSIFGNGAGSNDSFSLYLGRLPMIIKPHWILPTYLLEKNLKCRIRIFLGSNGQLLKLNIFETSGNTEYDKKALLAVQKAAPFPELADSFQHRAMNGDIVLGFPL